jgi:hypothetical protein
VLGSDFEKARDIFLKTQNLKAPQWILFGKESSNAEKYPALLVHSCSLPFTRHGPIYISKGSVAVYIYWR